LCKVIKINYYNIQEHKFNDMTQEQWNASPLTEEQKQMIVCQAILAVSGIMYTEIYS
jgi:hypothetical protein